MLNPVLVGAQGNLATDLGMTVMDSFQEGTGEYLVLVHGALTIVLCGFLILNT